MIDMIKILLVSQDHCIDHNIFSEFFKIYRLIWLFRVVFNDLLTYLLIFMFYILCSTYEISN